MINRFSILIASVLLAGVVASGTAREALSTRPNFIVIYTDDMRADGLGFLGGHVQTPHLDRLAQRSVYFPQAFVVSALCSPSRASC